MRHFLIEAPDGRSLERDAETVQALKSTLVEGYTLRQEVIDGLRIDPLPDHLPEHNIATYLLHVHGETVKAWMREWLPDMIGDAVRAQLDAKPKKGA